METTSTDGNKLGDALQHTAETARGEAHKLAEDAKRSGEALVSERKNNLAEQLGSVAHALRHSADELNAQGQRTSTQLLSSLASGMEQVSQALRDSDLRNLSDRARSYAHREPTLFIGGAVAAGFILSRFFKSSSTPRY